VVKEDLRTIGEAQRGPHLVLLALDDTGYRTLCRLISRANFAGTKSVPRFTHDLLAAHTEGLVALSGCREGEVARRLRVGDRAGARAVAETYARLFRPAGSRNPIADAGFVIELQHHLLPDDDWLVAERVRPADEVGLPVVVTNDVHYASPDGRELHDVVTAIRHGRTLDTLADLRRPDGESYLKGEAELLALPPADAGGVAADPRTARAWALSRWPWHWGQRTARMYFSSCILRGPAAVFLKLLKSWGMTPSHLPPCFQTLPARCFHSKVMCLSPLPCRSHCWFCSGTSHHGVCRSIPKLAATPS
jgi:hypothetical protein